MFQKAIGSVALFFSDAQGVGGRAETDSQNMEKKSLESLQEIVRRQSSKMYGPSLPLPFSHSFIWLGRLYMENPILIVTA